LIRKCEGFFPVKHELFKDLDSPVLVLKKLKKDLESIEDNALDERSTLADEVKEFVDNFASENNKLRKFLSKYPTYVKDSIIEVLNNDKYNTSSINYNLSDLHDCNTVLPIHSFYFELIIKEIFDNILQEYKETSVQIIYKYDIDFIEIIQDKPFKKTEKKYGGLFYIKSLIELFDGLFEQNFDNESYKIKFTFKSLNT